ncbi:MAG: T9SS type A sorting domain-containing protein [Bacteroidota bacterium]
MKKTIFAIALTVITLKSFAQAGRLDGSFSTDGVHTTDFYNSNEIGNSIAVQSDGKIIVAGYSFNGSNNDFALARYNKNGTLDITFSGDGKVTTDFSNNDDFGNSVAMQADGKIVVAGYSTGTTSDFALSRYNTDGTLDNTFSIDGKLTTDFSNTDDKAYSIAIQADSKIVVVGYSVDSSSDFAIARYNTNGTLDNTFSLDGINTTDFFYGDDKSFSVAIQSDGNIVVAGYGTKTNSDFAVARYNANGMLDNSFSEDGKTTTDITTSTDIGKSVAIQNDGKIVVGGYGFNTTFDIALARYSVNGELDNSFSADGMVTTDFTHSFFGSTNDFGKSLAIQSNGKIVIAVARGNFNNSNFGLTRYNEDGSLDNLFDDGFEPEGIIVTPVGLNHDEPYFLALQTDGKILVAGSSNDGSNDNFVVLRYNNDAILSVFDNTEKPNFVVYPNPTNGKLKILGIETSYIKKDENFEIYNLLGEKIYSTKINSDEYEIDVSNLQNGIYTYVIKTTNGFLNEKFILNK